jgi:hypothetical protein
MALFQEPFTGTNGTTPTDWTNRVNAVVIQSNEGAGSTAFSSNVAQYTGQQFGSAQYTKAIIRAFGTAVAVGVRCTGASFDGYWLHTSGTDAIIFRNLVTNILSITVTFTVGDVIELRASGTTLTAYKNGSAISGGSVTDATYSDGYGGVFFNGTDGRLDDFETGDIASASRAGLILHSRTLAGLTRRGLVN